MKSSELRIGNLIKWGSNNDKFEKVNRLNDGCIGLESDTIYDTMTPCGLLSGIPISEWFLKSYGFVYDKVTGNYWKDCQTHYLELIKEDDEVYPVWVTLPEFSSENEQHSTINAIKYIHQLQNLYFALTGEELILT